MIKIAIGIVIGFILGTTITAFAASGFMNTATWTGKDRTLDLAMHTGYVAGIVDTMDMIGKVPSDPATEQRLIGIVQAAQACVNQHRYEWTLGNYADFIENLMHNPPVANSSAATNFIGIMATCPKIK